MSLGQYFEGGFFDHTTVTPTGAALPAGQYPVWSTNVEVKPTKAGTGYYLEIEWVIYDGQHKNRKLWDRFNIRNPNPAAVQISKENLAALCKACNLPEHISEEEQLHNIAAIAHVIVDKSGQNKIQTYSSIHEYDPNNASAAPAAAANRVPTAPQAAVATQAPVAPPQAAAAPQAPVGPPAAPPASGAPARPWEQPKG